MLNDFLTNICMDGSQPDEDKGDGWGGSSLILLTRSEVAPMT